MPRTTVDYSKTIIYKIICDDLPEYIYIGHTTDFTRRKSDHKKCSKTKESKLYKTIRENGGFENWKMIEIEEFACENGRQAEKREQYYMDLFKSNLNSYKSFTTKEQKIEYVKQYNLEHKEQHDQYYLEHKKQKIEYVKKYSLEHKEEIKQYRLEHKEQTKQYNKEYQQQNKEQLTQKFTCECGSIITMYHKSHHYKTQKHLNFISQSNLNEEER